MRYPTINTNVVDPLCEHFYANLDFTHSDHVFIQTGYPKFAFITSSFFNTGSASFFLHQTWMANTLPNEPRDRSNTRAGRLASSGEKTINQQNSSTEHGYED